MGHDRGLKRSRNIRNPRHVLFQQKMARIFVHDEVCQIISQSVRHDVFYVYVEVTDEILIRSARFFLIKMLELLIDDVMQSSSDRIMYT